MRIIRSAAVLLSLCAGFAQAQGADQLAAAAMRDNPAMAQTALDAGVDLNAKVGEGRTALITAVMMVKPAMVKFLLDRGADPNREAEGPTIGNALSAAFFATSGAALTRRGEEEEIKALRAPALEILRLVAARKPDFNVLVSRGTVRMSALMIAADAGIPDAVKILLDAGASPNFANAGRYTALDYAVARAPRWSPASPADRAEVVRLLVAAGAQTRKKAADGLTPIERAKHGGNQAVIAALSG